VIHFWSQKRWAPFLPGFSGILPRFLSNQNFQKCACTPELPPSTPLFGVAQAWTLELPTYNMLLLIHIIFIYKKVSILLTNVQGRFLQHQQSRHHGLVGQLSSPNKVSRPNILKDQTVWISGVFVKFWNVKPVCSSGKPLSFWRRF